MNSDLRAKQTRRLPEECSVDVAVDVQSIQRSTAKNLVDAQGHSISDENGKPIGVRKYVEVVFDDAEVCEKAARKLRRLEWGGVKLSVYRGEGKGDGSVSSATKRLGFEQVVDCSSPSQASKVE